MIKFQSRGSRRNKSQGKERSERVAKKERKGAVKKKTQHVTEALMKWDATKGWRNSRPRLKGLRKA